MTILYISHLSTNIAAGLNWSVPASVDAQSKIDNVLWVNVTNGTMLHWLDVKSFHCLTEFGKKLKLSILPEPFNNPDIVIFEGFYYLDDVFFSKELIRKHIPYVIIPRGSLTYRALHNHAWLKKGIAHLLFFNRFVKKAKAIQYLTHQEANDSIGYFKTPYFIVPNGFSRPNVSKSNFINSGIRATFIGRLDIYHKGLDLLMEALLQIHDFLKTKSFHLTIYGPKRYDYYKIEKAIENMHISDICSIHDEVGGKDKENVLLDTDLFVMTSRFEGHPMGLIEALAYGIPCLVTEGTNMASEIINAKAGWGCKTDVDEIKESIISAVSQTSSYEIIGKKARKLAEEYDWQNLAARFHNEIEKLILE